MNYVITGGAGNISKPLTLQLLAAGHKVTVIGRNPQHLKELQDAGATIAAGSVEDRAFLTATFRGADAVYTMVPPNFGASPWKDWIASIGANYAHALREAGTVKHVVNLSSIGAHLPEGAGPVSGLHHVETALNQLEGIHVLHLRPGYFYQNFFANLGMVREHQIFGNNASQPDTKMILAHPEDIARVAAEQLLNPGFTGHQVLYIASDERTPSDIVKTIGAAIGKPELPYILFSDEDTLAGMKSAGLPDEVAANYTEMGHAMRTGLMLEDYNRSSSRVSGKVKLEDFAREFAGAYQAAG